MAGRTFALEFIQDGKKLVMGGTAAGLRMWDADTAELTDITDGEVRQMRFSADGTVIAMSGHAGFRLWDSETDELTVYTDNNSNELAALNPDGTLLVTSTDDGVHLWQR